MIRPAKESLAFQKPWKQAVAEQDCSQRRLRVSLQVVQRKFPVLAPTLFRNSFRREKQQDRGGREACLPGGSNGRSRMRATLVKPDLGLRPALQAGDNPGGPALKRPD